MSEERTLHCDYRKTFPVFSHLEKVGREIAQQCPSSPESFLAEER